MIGGSRPTASSWPCSTAGSRARACPDLALASTGADDKPNKMKCTGGSDCLWHGTEVASAAAGVIDNGLGAFGSGGQVAEVMMFHNDGALFSALGAVYDAADAGAEIINISSGYELGATVSFFNIPYEDATQTALERGALVVASAGNDGRDVDAEDCFVVCWEQEWIAPCGNDPVICVGGITPDGRRDASPTTGARRAPRRRTATSASSAR